MIWLGVVSCFAVGCLVFVVAMVLRSRRIADRILYAVVKHGAMTGRELSRMPGIPLFGIYTRLARLEDTRWLASRWHAGPYTRQRVYWATTKTEVFVQTVKQRLATGDSSGFYT